MAYRRRASRSRGRVSNRRSYGTRRRVAPRRSYGARRTGRSYNRAGGTIRLVIEQPSTVGTLARPMVSPLTQSAKPGKAKF